MRSDLIAPKRLPEIDSPIKGIGLLGAICNIIVRNFVRVVAKEVQKPIGIVSAPGKPLCLGVCLVNWQVVIILVLIVAEPDLGIFFESCV